MLQLLIFPQLTTLSGDRVISQISPVCFANPMVWEILKITIHSAGPFWMQKQDCRNNKIATALFCQVAIEELPVTAVAKHFRPGGKALFRFCTDSTSPGGIWGKIGIVQETNCFRCPTPVANEVVTVGALWFLVLDTGVLARQQNYCRALSQGAFCKKQITRTNQEKFYPKAIMFLTPASIYMQG